MTAEGKSDKGINWQCDRLDKTEGASVRKFLNESWLVLVLGVVFALLLAGTQTQLAGRIAGNQQNALDRAVADVVPDVARSEELLDAQGQPVVKGSRIFRCTAADGRLAGWAVQTSGTGFVDKINLVFGVSADGKKITGLKVIENVETPGLGNKISENTWAGQYINLDATKEIAVTKGPADASRNEIQAITGATWSSHYVTDIVNQAIQQARPKVGEKR